MSIRTVIRKIIYRERASSEDYVRYLREKGVEIGEETWFPAPNDVVIDETRPYMIHIGNGVCITHGVHILTHDYAWSVIRRKYGIFTGSAGSVQIGDNVFIGNNAIILKGVTIGDNVIIAAGSIVSKDIPSDCVAVGAPACPVCSLQEYKDKRERKAEGDAREAFLEYYRHFGKVPPVEELREFFWLFEKRTPGKTPGYSAPSIQKKTRKRSEYPLIEKEYFASEPLYDGYDAFVEACLAGEKQNESGK